MLSPFQSWHLSTPRSCHGQLDPLVEEVRRHPEPAALRIRLAGNLGYGLLDRVPFALPSFHMRGTGPLHALLTSAL